MKTSIKFPKLGLKECTLCVGGEVTYASMVEAVVFGLYVGLMGDKIAPTLLTNVAGENQFCWGFFDKKGKLLSALPIFENEMITSFNKQLKEVKVLNLGGYIREGNRFYIPFDSDEYGVIIRELVVFSTANDARAVWELSLLDDEAEDPDDELEISLVRVTKVDAPNETLCIAWMLEKGCIMKLHPVFAEEGFLLDEDTINSLNWEVLEEGESFMHKKDAYIVCRDNDGLYVTKPFTVAKA